MRKKWTTRTRYRKSTLPGQLYTVLTHTVIYIKISFTILLSFLNVYVQFHPSSHPPSQGHVRTQVVPSSVYTMWFNLRLCYVKKLLNWDEYKQTKRGKYKRKRDHLGPYGPLGNLLLCKLPLIVRVPEMDNACRVSVWNFWVQISDILTACI